MCVLRNIKVRIMSIFEFQISNCKCSIWAREDRYSHDIPISNFIFQILNFNIIGVYKQHNLCLYHQLPSSPSQNKKSQPVKKSRPGQEVPPGQENMEILFSRSICTESVLVNKYLPFTYLWFSKITFQLISACMFDDWRECSTIWQQKYILYYL